MLLGEKKTLYLHYFFCDWKILILSLLQSGPLTLAIACPHPPIDENPSRVHFFSRLCCRENKFLVVEIMIWKISDLVPRHSIWKTSSGDSQGVPRELESRNFHKGVKKLNQPRELEEEKLMTFAERTC